MGKGKKTNNRSDLDMGRDVLYDEFFEKVSKLLKYRPKALEKNTDFSREKSSFKNDDAVIMVKWCTGGVEGGSCWDNDNLRSFVSNEEPPELVDLDLIVGHFAPECSFIQWKLLAHKIKHTSKTEYEYYGNQSNYTIKYIKLYDVYNYLKENGFLK